MGKISMKRAWCYNSIGSVIRSTRSLEMIDIRDCSEFGSFGRHFWHFPHWLAECKKLKTFIMNNSMYVNDILMTTLGEHCKYVKHLCLDKCFNVSDASITVIANSCVGMKVFSLRNTQITDKSIVAIADNCPELRSLNLRNCSVTSKGIGMIAQNCKQLQSLDITRVPGPISLDCLRQISKNCLNLRIIHLDTFEGNFLPDAVERRHFLLRKDCSHCRKIAKNEVPILVQEIGIQMNQLCFEGFIVSRNSTICHCMEHK